jgi:Domain of unknown function (DUF4398)
VIRALVAFMAVAALVACGPVHSTALLIDADRQVEEARKAGAENDAPYEWTAATLYLHKAREEVGRSQYEYAVAFARKATTYASAARTAALNKAKSEKDPAVRQ